MSNFDFTKTKPADLRLAARAARCALVMSSIRYRSE